MRTLIALVAALIVAAPAQAQTRDGLVAEYLLNETSGTVVHDTSSAARDATLSKDEVMRNFESATGTVYAAQPSDRQSPDDRVPILLKPTRASFGGSEHHGVGIFPAYPAQDLAHDAEYQALAAWVAGKTATGKEQACADMFMKLGLTPQ